MSNKSYLKIKCHKCGNEQLAFSRASTQIKCNKKDCGTVLAVPTGGKVHVKAEIIELI